MAKQNRHPTLVGYGLRYPEKRPPRLSTRMKDWLILGLSGFAFATSLGLFGYGFVVGPSSGGSENVQRREYASALIQPHAWKPNVFVHQGLEIVIGQNGDWHGDEDIRTIQQIAGVIDKYPDGFVADTCGLRAVHVLPVEDGSRVGGRYFSLAKTAVVYIEPGSGPRHRIENTVVHEIDHACVLTNRSLDDLAAWDSLVTIPEEIHRVVETRDYSGAVPEGFARWYGTSTAFSENRLLRHVEDKATIKELMTVDWRTIDSRNDRVLEAKVDLHIEWYSRLSGGVMDEAYFRSWSEPGFSYADRHEFLEK